MSVIVVLIGLVMLGMAINAVVITRGGILNEFNYFEIAKVIGGSIFAVLLMSLYGGIAGGIIMTLAAHIRKRRGRKEDSKAA